MGRVWNLIAHRIAQLFIVFLIFSYAAYFAGIGFWITSVMLMCIFWIARISAAIYLAEVLKGAADRAKRDAALTRDL